MKKIISSIKKKFPKASTTSYEKAFILAYLTQNKLKYDNSKEIIMFLDVISDEILEIMSYINTNIFLQDIDNLVIAFEILVNDLDKKNKGVVYTPPEIRDFICHRVIHTDYIPTVIDPSCGCGAFLISAARYMHHKYKISYNEIFTKYIWGCDIDYHSVQKAKVLFDILLLENDSGNIDNYKNMLIGNALELFTKDIYKYKYDVVVGNPPYVRSKNIQDNVKDSLKNWEVISGNTDLYIPFYQIGIELLNTNGKLGYISPNTFLQSVNGRRLRDYLRDINADISIINFKDSQKFLNITHYTCILIIDAVNANGDIQYAVCEDSLDSCNYTAYNITENQNGAEWRFANKNVDRLIYKIENQPSRLDDYNIRNGLATLCNELFFFSVIGETEQYYIRTYKGKKYEIEKNICIDVAKPNVMKTETDLITKSEKAIYPYKNGSIICEEDFKYEYPSTYDFLLEYKDVLAGRDKGKTESYASWYAYGRTQGMRNTGKKILIPYIADKGVAIISENPELLFYCGYAAFSEDIKVLKLLKIFIESDIFWFYIKMTSKPYSKGYMALAKNYIKNFGIPNISEDILSQLLLLEKDEREEFIANLYDINLSEIADYIHR